MHIQNLGSLSIEAGISHKDAVHGQMYGTTNEAMRRQKCNVLFIKKMD